MSSISACAGSPWRRLNGHRLSERHERLSFIPKGSHRDPRSVGKGTGNGQALCRRLVRGAPSSEQRGREGGVPPKDISKAAHDEHDFRRALPHQRR